MLPGLLPLLTIADWDRAVVEAFQSAHWHPADEVFEVLSSWWVKSIVIVAAVLLADLRRRLRVPCGALLAAASYGVADGLTTLLKVAVDRPRPPVVDAAVHPLVAVPSSASMPSGHASTAFAAAAAAGLVHRSLRLPMLVLGALIAISRVWLGVHYLSDVLVGSALGAAVALALWWSARRILGRRARAR